MIVYTMQGAAGVMELVDVVDSKSTASDSVPVRVRSPAPINAIVNDTFTMGFILCTGRTRNEGESLGSEGSAACGGRSDPSEWQRSVGNAVAPSARRTPGTATGHRHHNTYPYLIQWYHQG